MADFIIIGEVKNQEQINSFGRFQGIYQKEDGIDATTVAKNMLKGIERTGTIEALGNINCVTGYAVTIQDDYLNWLGLFQIDGDSHTWENGKYTMTLELNFDKVMDESEYKQKVQKAKSKSGTVVFNDNW